jgi:WG containing repeat
MCRVATTIALIISTFLSGFSQSTEGTEWEWAIKPQFDNEPSPFTNGLARVEIKGKYGFIDKTGKVVIAPQFNYAYSFAEGLAPITQNNKWGFIDKTGKVVIQPQFESAHSFSEGLATIEQNDKWGFIDKTGKIVIQPQFQYASPFHEGLAIINQNDKWGFIDKTGKIVIQPQFDEVTGNFSEGLLSVRSSNGKWGYVDKTGKFIIQPIFQKALEFSEGLAVVEINDKKRFIDKTGSLALQFDKWVYVYPFSEGLAEWVSQGTGFIDKQGRTVIHRQFSDVSGFSEGLAVARFEYEKWGFIKLRK